MLGKLALDLHAHYGNCYSSSLIENSQEPSVDHYKPIVQAMRCRNALHRSLSKSNADHTRSKYKEAHSLVVSLLHQSIATYFQNLSSRGQKEFWKAVKLLNKQDSSIPTLTDSTGVSIVSSSEKASLLNNFFFKCFNHDLPPLQVSQPLHPISCPEELLCSVEEIAELLLDIPFNLINLLVLMVYLLGCLSLLLALLLQV